MSQLRIGYNEANDANHFALAYKSLASGGAAATITAKTTLSLAQAHGGAGIEIGRHEEGRLMPSALVFLLCGGDGRRHESEMRVESTDP